MMKKVLSIIALVGMLFVLAACSALGQEGSTSSTTNQDQANLPNMADQPIEGKLAVGTLSLEGTENAITAEQAKNLLPLWKAVKSLVNSSTAADDELTALYQQIQEAMTAEQIQVIKDMQLGPDETQALMTKYGVELPQGGNMPELSDEQKATLEARRASGNQGGDFAGGGMPPDGAGGPPDGGGMPPDGGGFQGGGNTQGGGAGQPDTQGTPQAPQGGRGMRGGGMNTLLVEPLIKLLEERVG